MLCGWHLGTHMVILSACLAKGFLISTKSQAGPFYPEVVILFQDEEGASVCAQKMPVLSVLGLKGS